jgi:hypothetical protein
MSAGDPSRTQTASISAEAARELDHPVPGLVLVFSAGKPQDVALPLVGGALTVGRGETTAALIEDACLSRKHGEVHFDGERFVVRDLGSRNGSSADGERIPAGGTTKVARVLRMGDSIFLPLADLRPFLCARPVQISDGWVAGPALQRAYERIAQAARFALDAQLLMQAIDLVVVFGHRLFIIDDQLGEAEAGLAPVCHTRNLSLFVSLMA